MKLQSSHRPTDTAADARLEQEAKNEERDIKRVCDQLGLDMFEVGHTPRYKRNHINRLRDLTRFLQMVIAYSLL